MTVRIYDWALMIQRHQYPYEGFGGWCMGLQGIVNDDGEVYCVVCCFAVAALDEDHSRIPPGDHEKSVYSG